MGWFGGSIQPRSPLKFTLDILVYAESTLMSKILATVKVDVLRANLIALNLNEGSPWIGDGATGRWAAVH